MKNEWKTRGATTTEYLVVLALIACTIIAIVKVYGATVDSKYRWADERLIKKVTF